MWWDRNRQNSHQSKARFSLETLKLWKAWKERNPVEIERFQRLEPTRMPRCLRFRGVDQQKVRHAIEGNLKLDGGIEYKKVGVLPDGSGGGK